MPSYDAGMTVGIDGEAEFKKSLGAINSTLKALGSELKAVTAEFQDNADSMKALTAKADVLRRSISENEKRLDIVTAKYQEQQTAVNGLAAELQKITQEYGANSKEAAQAQRAYDAAYKELQYFADQANRTRTNLGNLRSQLSKVESQMDASENAYESLSRKISDQKSELERLLKEHTNAVITYGKTSNEAKALAGDISKLSGELKQSQAAMRQAEKETEGLGVSLDDAENSAGSLSDSIGNLIGKAGGTLAKAFAVGAIVEGVKSLISSMVGLVDETMEYRRIMGTLEVSSQAAGYTAEQTSQTYERLYAVLGDNQMAATATANLQAIGLSQKELMTITDAAIGAWASYGDSIPIDSLAESINETIRAGQVTGTFADVLNWGAKEGETFGVTMRENTEANKEWNESVADAETAEDYFNLALQDCQTQAERADLVLQAMASQGLTDAAEAWRDNNEAIVETNQAQADFEEAQARLGEELSPIKDALTNLATDGFNFLADAVADAKDAMEELNDWWEVTKQSLMDLLGIEPPAKAIKNYADGVKSAVKHEFEIHSPSQWAADEVGIPLGQGVAEGLEDSVSYVDRAAERIGQAVEDKILETQTALEQEQTDLVKETLDTQLEALETFRDEYTSALEDIRSRQQSMADRLSGYGDLFTWTETNSADILDLGDLQEQIDAIREYGAALEALKARGTSESLLEEIVGLSVDDATAYTNRLLKMTDEEYASYIALWEEKQAAAADIARQFYSNELRGLEEEFVDKLPEALNELKAELEAVGSNCALGLAEGFKAESNTVRDAFVSTTEDALAAAEQAMGVHSPSTVWAGFGKNLALGLDNGFTEAMEAVSVRMTRAIPTPTIETVRQTAAGVVNGISAINSGIQFPREIVLTLENGQQIARWLLPYSRAAARANPEVGTT